MFLLVFGVTLNSEKHGSIVLFVLQTDIYCGNLPVNHKAFSKVS